MARRILNVILCVLMSISLTACTTQSSQDILNGGMSQFVKYYGQIRFKASKIEYNENKRIKYILFEQIIN